MGDIVKPAPACLPRRSEREVFRPPGPAPAVPARFGSSGIRGPALTEVGPELLLRLGQAVGEAHRRVVVGRDGRTTGFALQQAFVAGVLAAGAEAYDAGMLPTPALAHAARRFDLGAVLTASHNPAADNGLKLWTPRGQAVGEAERARVEAALAKAPARAGWELQALREARGCIEDHARAIAGRVRVEKPLTVVVDAGNGVGALETPAMLRGMGCRVVTLNGHVDGAFPGRPSEPSAENLAALCAAVRELGADLGLAHDGDADRVVAVDERGRPVSGDALLALLGRELGARRVVVPVDTSLAVQRALPGTEFVHTKVGDAFVSEAVAARGADFGGEPSGAIVFPQLSLCPDGPHGAALVAAMVARRGSLAALADGIPPMATLRASVPLGAADRGKAMEAIAQGLRRMGEPDLTDGVKVAFDDGWVLVRPSGTEPKVRLTAEAEREPRARELLERALALVKEALR